MACHSGGRPSKQSIFLQFLEPELQLERLWRKSKDWNARKIASQKKADREVWDADDCRAGKEIESNV